MNAAQGPEERRGAQAGRAPRGRRSVLMALCLVTCIPAHPAGPGPLPAPDGLAEGLA